MQPLPHILSLTTQQIVELLLETAGRAEAERLKMEAMGDIQVGLYCL
jgi:hypothetical protein